MFLAFSDFERWKNVLRFIALKHLLSALKHLIFVAISFINKFIECVASYKTNFRKDKLVEN